LNPTTSSRAVRKPVAPLSERRQQSRPDAKYLYSIAFQARPRFRLPEWKLLAAKAGGLAKTSTSTVSEGKMQIGVETSKAVDQRRVFVVDDDEITRAALQFMLHDEIETHELATPEEAYEKVGGDDWLKPHVVMLGVSFLKTRGVGVIKEIKDKFSGCRILIVTDKSDEATAVDGLKNGAHGAVVKPLTLEAVRKKVDTILGRSGGDTIVQLGGLKK
jgi:PleD family two-component response regulator